MCCAVFTMNLSLCSLAEKEPMDKIYNMDKIHNLKTNQLLEASLLLVESRQNHNEVNQALQGNYCPTFQSYLARVLNSNQR